MRASARIRANRRNALRSTGPRTLAGKAVAAQNARTHGLSTRAAGQRRDFKSALMAEFDVETLTPESRLLAQAVADAQACVVNVARIMAEQIQELEERPSAEAFIVLERLARYDRRAQSRFRTAVRHFERAREQTADPLDSVANAENESHD